MVDGFFLIFMIVYVLLCCVVSLEQPRMAVGTVQRGMRGDGDGAPRTS